MDQYITIQTPKNGAQLLVDVPKSTLEWSNITKIVKVKNPATKTTENKTILNNVSGVAMPGELVVLMGPS
ncbi:hypothetical protein THRCLA_22144, partial [Thraustotheca clavata]